jgi:hypothetical protein
MLYSKPALQLCIWSRSALPLRVLHYLHYNLSHPRLTKVLHMTCFPACITNPAELL